MQTGQINQDTLLFTFNSHQLLPPPPQPPRLNPTPPPIPPLRQFRSKRLKPFPTHMHQKESQLRPFVDQALNRLLATPEQIHRLPNTMLQASKESYSFASKQLPPHRSPQGAPKEPQSMQELDIPRQYIENDRKLLSQSRQQKRRTVSLRETPKVDFNQKKLPRVFRLKSMSQDKKRVRRGVVMGRDCLTQESGGMRKKTRYLLMGEVNNEESPRFN